MTAPIKLQWKLGATTACCHSTAPLPAPVVAGGKCHRTTPAAQKARAQVGICGAPASAPSGALVKSGELCSDKTVLKKKHARGVKYDDDELAYLAEQSKAVNVSVHEYIRATSLCAAYKPLQTILTDPDIRQELRMVKRQLIGIGINLNQLMHKVNAGTGGTDPVLDYIEVVREPVLDAIKMIRKALSRRADGPMP